MILSKRALLMPPISVGPYVMPRVPPARGPLPQAPGSTAVLTPAQQIEVIIPQGGIGSFHVLRGDGGVLTRYQQPMSHYGGGHNNFQVVKLRGAKKEDRDKEEMDVLTIETTVFYDSLAVGETFFQ